MTDTEKVALIAKLISDFWDRNEAEDRKDGAIHVVNAIDTVLQFGGKNDA